MWANFYIKGQSTTLKMSDWIRFPETQVSMHLKSSNCSGLIRDALVPLKHFWTQFKHSFVAAEHEHVFRILLSHWSNPSQNRAPLPRNNTSFLIRSLLLLSLFFFLSLPCSPPISLSHSDLHPPASAQTTSVSLSWSAPSPRPASSTLPLLFSGLIKGEISLWVTCQRARSSHKESW